MTRKRFDFFSVAIGIAGLCAVVPAHATDLSISAMPGAYGDRLPAIAAGSADASSARPLSVAPRSERGKRMSAKTGRPPDKAPPPKILTYSLSGAPALLPPAAAAGIGRFPAVPATAMPALGLSGIAARDPAVPHAGESAGRPARSGLTDGAGLAFDCRDRAGAPGFPRRFTACYRHQLDKAWKAQTYVSKGLLDGSSGWGGGVVVVYAH